LPTIVVAVLLWQWHPWRLERYQVASVDQIYTVATGTWDWDSDSVRCGPMTHQISFSPDHRLMVLRGVKPWTLPDGTSQSTAEYEIREVTRSHIRAFMRGESRRTPGGELVVWDLVLTSLNSYAWHEADWPNFALTGRISRCPISDPSTRLLHPDP
jgi:hypothetical protein